MNTNQLILALRTEIASRPADAVPFFAYADILYDAGDTVKAEFYRGLGKDFSQAKAFYRCEDPKHRYWYSFYCDKGRWRISNTIKDSDYEYNHHIYCDKIICYIGEAEEECTWEEF